MRSHGSQWEPHKTKINQPLSHTLLPVNLDNPGLICEFNKSRKNMIHPLIERIILILVIMKEAKITKFKCLQIIRIHRIEVL